MGLLQAIDIFLRERRMTPSKFGRLAVNDPRLVPDLRRGRVLRRPTIARIEGFMRAAGGRA